MDYMETKYDTTEWESETVLGRRLFIYNYAMRGNELSGWELVKTVIVQHEPDVTEKTYLWKRKSAEEELIQVYVIETPYWSHAQQYLKMQLHHCMHPEIPRGTSKAANIGDVQYVGKAGDSSKVEALFFSRGNLQINVRSAGKKAVDVLRFAQDMDARFVKPPVKSGPKAQASRKLRPGKVSVKKGQKAVIVEKLPEPVTRSGWLRVEVPDGEIRREGDSLYYIPDTAGAKSIQIVRLSME